MSTQALSCEGLEFWGSRVKVLGLGFKGLGK